MTCQRLEVTAGEISTCLIVHLHDIEGLNFVFCVCTFYETVNKCVCLDIRGQATSAGRRATSCSIDSPVTWHAPRPVRLAHVDKRSRQRPTDLRSRHARSRRPANGRWCCEARRGRRLSKCGQSRRFPPSSGSTARRETIRPMACDEGSGTYDAVKGETLSVEIALRCFCASRELLSKSWVTTR